jgi:hypothetical protein
MTSPILLTSQVIDLFHSGERRPAAILAGIEAGGAHVIELEQRQAQERLPYAGQPLLLRLPAIDSFGGLQRVPCVLGFVHPIMLDLGRHRGTIVRSGNVKRSIVAAVFCLAITLTTVGTAAADPSNFPTNPNACVGNSSTTANVAYQDPDKERSDQARQDDGQPGRADSVANIPQCQGIDHGRGVIK